MPFIILLIFLVLVGPLSAQKAPRETFPSLPTTVEQRKPYEQFLAKRYRFGADRLTWGEKYPVVINGTDEKGFTPDISCAQAPLIKETYDSVVVGGGPAGLSASFFLTQKGKKVLLLEKEPTVGGLAAGSSLGTGRYARGGAYFTSVEGPAREVYDKLGMGDFKNLAIPEPIDSYLWNGTYYRGLWEDHTVDKLPADFAVFKFLLRQADKDKMVPVQPIEDHPAAKVLDPLSFAEWVRSMPADLKKRADAGDEKARALWVKLQNDPTVNKSDPMSNVIKKLEIYGRSALGDHPDVVSAAVGVNFYIAELDTRYTTNIGAGGVAEKIFKKLVKDPDFKHHTTAPVGEVRNFPQGVEVCYSLKGKTLKVRGKTAVLTAPLSVAKKGIKDLETLAPEKKKVLESLEYRNYQVVNLHVAGHPWRDTYDLWIRDDATYSKKEPTDIIDGRWMDFRGQEKPRTDNKGVITVYVPLPKEMVGKGYDNQATLEIAVSAAEKAQAILNPLIARDGGKPMQVLAVEANRWPFSIHIAAPGHFLKKAKVLAAPAGNIYFASMNIGAPAIEEATYRGYIAASDILRKTMP